MKILTTKILYHFSKVNINEIPTLANFLQQPQICKENNGTAFYIETYGCQMNSNDSQIVTSILQQNGYARTLDIEQAQIVFLNTCSIRANAENKVFQRMTELKNSNKILGILGCMAERLKQQLFEKGADVIVGPDGYKSLPQLLSEYQETRLNQIDTELSLTETYDDVIPINPTEATTTYVSIMRGCNNMCSFCIVPFTRGRERSRNPQSIIKEIQQLGVKEVTLLGQNVNSYHFKDESIISQHQNSEGFNELYKLRQGNGMRFDQLLDLLANQFPEIRFRFTSPHPKNFPDKVIDVISKHPNIAKNIHIPIQSGSDNILQKMRRNYKRDALINLCKMIRMKLPGCTLSTDVIVGFCDESEDDFQQTLDLMNIIRFENAFMFAYSMRERTHAHRNYIDNVDEQTKLKRLNKLIEQQHKIMLEVNQMEKNKHHLVLVEQEGNKQNQLKGRSDTNITIVFDNQDGKYQIGDFVVVQIEEVGLKTLKGKAIKKSSIKEFQSDYVCV